MKKYAFRKKLIIILCISIFVPMLLICLLIGCITINKQKKELAYNLEKVVDNHKLVIRETYNDCNMMAQSLSDYKTLNLLLSESEKIPLNTMLDYSNEIRNVIGSIITSKKKWDITIYTENPFVPEMKYIKKLDNTIKSKYEVLSEKNDVTLQFEIDGEKTYLNVLKKYRVVADSKVGNNIIEIKIPISNMLPGDDNAGEAIYIVYEDSASGRIIPLYPEEEAVRKYDTVKEGRELLKLEYRCYRLEYFEGNFYVMMDKQSYIETIVKIIFCIILAFLVFAVCIWWVVQYTTQHLTKRLVDIVSAIRYDSIETLLSSDNSCDEFDIIEKKIASLAQDLKKENDKVLKLELEALNHRLAPHFIYNNLSVLKWKCDDRDIDHIIDCMVAYCRNVFQKNSAFAIVDEEVDNLTNYIKLLQFAYEEDFEYPISKSQKDAWQKNRQRIADGMEINETDDFYSTLRIGTLPHRTCLSYLGGMHRDCVLAGFDSNKKMLLASKGSRVVGRAVIRLTKGSSISPEDQLRNENKLEFADLLSKETEIQIEKDIAEDLVLFLEKPYFAYISEEEQEIVKQLFVELISEKAEELNAVAVLANAYYQSAMYENFVRQGYYLYISRSKSGVQYLDSLSGEDGTSTEGSYKVNTLLVQHRK